MGRLQDDPTELVKAKELPRRLPKGLTRLEIESLLSQPDTESKGGIRDRAMLEVAYGSGLRVSELVGLRIDEVEFDGRYVDVRVRGKGRRERALPLWKSVADAIRAWLAVRGEARAPELFLNAWGKHMTRSGFERVLSMHVATAAVKQPSLRQKRVSPHVLRHTCALNILQATRDLRKVSLWLGHASTQTTDVYLQADPTEEFSPHRALQVGARFPHFQVAQELIAEEPLEHRALEEALHALG